MGQLERRSFGDRSRVRRLGRRFRSLGVDEGYLFFFESRIELLDLRGGEIPPLN